MTIFRSLAYGSVMLAGLTLTASAQETAPPEDAILILDASGSMWGQIDGVNKIVIAKDVVEGLVRGLPEDQRLGMVAYGHRKKGDCSDIQTLADVGADRDKVIDQIRSLSPVGMTPLTSSVQHAATELDYTRNAATVILVSDGLETCDADPCALARTLEENGLDFTVHVIGFDVTEEERQGLVCIANETGGEFLTADTADELNDALTQVAMSDGEVAPSEAEGVVRPQTVALKATILQNGPDIQRDLNWTITNKDTGEVVFEKADTGYVDFEVVPGEYEANVVWTGWPHQGDRYKGDKTGSKDFTIEAAPTVVTVPIDLDIPVSLTADAEIMEGQPVSVTWSGPDDLGMIISTSALDDGPRDQIYFTPTQRARDAFEREATEAGTDIDSNGDGRFDQDDIAKTQIGGPSHEGDYEVRYILNSPRIILASVPLTVTDGNYSLSGPDEVPAGSTLTVDVGGPVRQNDALWIEKPDLRTAYYQGPRAKLTEAGAVEIVAPSEPGTYELRYVMANGYTTYPNTQHAVQARRPITVTSVSAAVSGPDTAIGGSVVAFDVTPVAGDEWADDYISIIEPGATKHNRDSWQVLSKGAEDGSSVEFQMPNIDGDYEVAYFQAPGDKVLARQPIRINRAEATIDAPARVKVGEAFDIAYSGPYYRGDLIIVAPADIEDSAMWGWTARYGFFAKEGETSGTYSALQSSRNLKPGEYVVRYVTGHQHQTLARDTLTVTE